MNLSEPVGVTLNIFSVEQLLSKIEKVEQLAENIMLVFGGTKDTLKFCKGYPKITEINFIRHHWYNMHSRLLGRSNLELENFKFQVYPDKLEVDSEYSEG